VVPEELRDGLDRWQDQQNYRSRDEMLGSLRQERVSVPGFWSVRTTHILQTWADTYPDARRGS
jgi:hypothetical protein